MNDLLRIGSNVQALQALNSLMNVNERIGVHQYRLATGKRVNSAEEDSAGYALARSLESRAGGLKQALRNVGNAKRILNIAEGGYQAQMAILQTIREKVTQATDGSLDSTQVGKIQTQVNELRKELDDINTQSKWNGSTVYGSAFSFQVGADAADTLSITAASFASNNVAVSTTVGASSAISTVDAAINTLAGNIQSIGDYQARLGYKEDSLAIGVTNTEAVRSSIEDADFAKEQMEVMKLQILQQTAMSALTQANSAPQVVLSLFR